MAADGRRHVLAIGGGMLMPRDTVPLQVRYAMDLTGRASPKLCVLNTAVGDAPESYLRFYDRLAETSAQVRHLALFPMPNVADPEDLLMSQDVIFVGGGSVANMIAVWRVHGVDEILRKAWQAGVVLAGSSAGGICWFEGGTTDSFGIKLRPFTGGLAMLSGSFCPHYNSEAERRPLYRRLVADGTLPGGIACDDGAGAHYTDETLAELVADRPGANAYRVAAVRGAWRDGESPQEEESAETALPVRFLGALRGPPRGVAGVLLAGDAPNVGGAYAERVRSIYGWLRGHPLVVDSALGVVVALLSLPVVAAPRPVVVPEAVLFTVGLFVAVTLRRRYPVGAFVLGIAVAGLEVVAVAGGLGEPERPRPVGSELAVGILLYTVAAYRRRRVSVAALLVCMVGSAIALLVWVPGAAHSGDLAGVAAASAGPALVAWLLGDSTNWRRSYYRGLEERAVRAERERDAHAQVAAAAERARIARELHDVVAHNVSVMVVQADGAAFALETSPEQTRQALTAISRTGRQALAEMRSMLGVLRAASDDEAELGPQPGVEQLTALLEQTRAAGLPVSFTVEGVPRPLRPGAALTAYRIVQESLTNARKHGGPTVTAAVTLGFCDDQLFIKVTDDGRARPSSEFSRGPDGLGQGLIGMRERVEVYGGTVTAGPQPRGGWRVIAKLPLAQGAGTSGAGGATAAQAEPGAA